MKKVLLQFDSDQHASSFDSIVAIDSDVDHLLRFSNVSLDNVTSLVYGAMFTRGGISLASTAIFVGGTDVEIAEQLMEKVGSTFFGSVRVSVMMDANGCNTTASAAVLSAEKHLDLKGQNVIVLGGTGPVGQRIAQLCAIQLANISIVSRSIEKAAQICDQVSHEVPGANLNPVEFGGSDYDSKLSQSNVIFSAGAAGIELIKQDVWMNLPNAKVLIDLNAVPPTGISGINPTDTAELNDDKICYGAIGVGGLKMKIHKYAIKQLFEANDLVLDAEQIYAAGQELIESNSN